MSRAEETALKRNHNLWYALSFLVPAALMLAVYGAMGMAPFGDKSILAMDMADQYVEFFCALKHGDVYFSWSKALGTTYIGVFTYYVSSPLSLLTLLVPNEAMPMGLMFLTVLKVGLIGLTYAIFTTRFFGKSGPAVLLGALAYALCSYTAAYSMCIMWLDGMIWLPLILLGLERLLAGRSAVPFAAALTVCFVSGWYVSYMVGGFCLLWFFYRAFCLKLKGRELVRPFLHFLGGAAWALLVAAWLWLPSFLSMFSGKLSDSTMDYSSLLNFGPKFFLQFLPGRYNSLTGSALPFVFCGVLTPALFLLSLFCRRFPLRERLGSLGLAAVLTLSLWAAPLDKVWHLFKFPNWFPYRYSFLLSFVLVLFAHRLLGEVLDRIPLRPRAAAAAVLTLLLCGELGYNALAILKGVDSQFGYESYSAYHDYYTINEGLLSHAEQDGFYRVGATSDRGFNSPLSFGYPGITHYSSVYNKDVNAALKALGFAQSWMWSAYYGSTPATDALLGIRYVLSRDELPGYEPVASCGELALYENPTVLPLAFAAEADALAFTYGGHPVQTQNRLYSLLTGSNVELFSPISPEISDNGSAVTLTFEGSGQPIYADLTGSGLRALWVDGAFRCWLTVSEEQRVHYLGTPAKGEELTVTIQYNARQTWRDRFYTFDRAALAAAVSTISSPQVEVDGTTVRLSGLELAEGQVLVTTIPDEDGWAARVNGKAVELSRFGDAFIALELPAGSYDITLRYIPPGLSPALALAAIALLWAAALHLHHKREKNGG